MATSVLIPVAEYLHTTYRPDRDYLDGEVKERNLGQQVHAHTQGILTGIFRERRKEWQVRVLPEQRVQVAATRFRIPDLCILRNTDPRDPIVTTPPLLCIEILSKDDTLRELRHRVDDYVRMGVENIWAIEPGTDEDAKEERAGYYASRQGFRRSEDGLLVVPGTPIAVSLAEVFAELDENA